MEIYRFLKKYILLFCMCKMLKISVEKFAENCIHTISQKRAKNQFYE